MSDVIDKLANASPPSAPPMSSELEAELRTVAAVKPRRPVRQIATLIGISLVYGAGLLAALSMRKDMTELPMGWIVGVAVGWLFGFVVPSYLALVPPAGSMMPRWQLGAASAIVASIAFIVLGLLVHPHGPSSLDYSDRFGHGHTCLEIGLATALVPVVVGAVFLRGALPVGSRWIAAALGAGGGCLGGLVLHLHCRVADPKHIGLIHGGVVLVSALLSALLVPRATDRPLR
ncbi:MAG TPA: NrsF family protein [Kofleriaceae bacterium]|jgi:hypothetical protein|nr:NrsF family protein [Kofleriaceae bacterium]